MNYVATWEGFVQKNHGKEKAAFSGLCQRLVKSLFSKQGFTADVIIQYFPYDSTDHTIFDKILHSVETIVRHISASSQNDMTQTNTLLLYSNRNVKNIFNLYSRILHKTNSMGVKLILVCDEDILNQVNNAPSLLSKYFIPKPEKSSAIPKEWHDLVYNNLVEILYKGKRVNGILMPADNMDQMYLICPASAFFKNDDTLYYKYLEVYRFDGNSMKRLILSNLNLLRSFDSNSSILTFACDAVPHLYPLSFMAKDDNSPLFIARAPSSEELTDNSIASFFTPCQNIVWQDNSTITEDDSFYSLSTSSLPVGAGLYSIRDGKIGLVGLFSDYKDSNIFGRSVSKHKVTARSLDLFLQSDCPFPLRFFLSGDSCLLDSIRKNNLFSLYEIMSCWQEHILEIIPMYDETSEEEIQDEGVIGNYARSIMKEIYDLFYYNIEESITYPVFLEKNIQYLEQKYNVPCSLNDYKEKDGTEYEIFLFFLLCIPDLHSLKSILSDHMELIIRLWQYLYASHSMIGFWLTLIDFADFDKHICFLETTFPYWEIPHFREQLHAHLHRIPKDKLFFYSYILDQQKNISKILFQICDQIVKNEFSLYELVGLSTENQHVFARENKSTEQNEEIQMIMEHENPFSWQFTFYINNSRQRNAYFGIIEDYSDPEMIFFELESFYDSASTYGDVKSCKKEDLEDTLREAFFIDRYENAQIVAMWYDSLFDQRIPSRILSFSSDVEIIVDELEHSITFRQKEHASTPHTDFFRCQDMGQSDLQTPSVHSRINNITALVGRNGTGKSTAFRMLAMDSPDFHGKSDFGDYVVFYRLDNAYSYSANLQNSNYKVIGLEKRDFSSRKWQNSIVVFYSAELSMNWRTRNRDMIGIDISNEYIFHNEFTSKDLKRFYETGRKVQLLCDLKSLEQFKEQFEFIPGRLVLTFPASFTALRSSLDALDQITYRISMATSEDQLIYSYEINEDHIEQLASYYNTVIGFLSSCISPEEDISGITFEFTGLSSGQYAVFDFYSRLHSFFESQYRTKENQAPYNCFTTDVVCRNYILLLDEIELFMHPKWQKEFIDKLISFLEWEVQRDEHHWIIDNIQIMLSSNSPFFMSDLPKENICMLCQEDEDPQKKLELLSSPTFGQNIHTILSKSFFMDDGLMGEFAKKKIEMTFRLLERVKEEGISLPPERLEEIRYIIANVGEPLIKKALERAYDRCFPPKRSDTGSIKGLLKGKIADDLLQQVLDSLEET